MAGWDFMDDNTRQYFLFDENGAVISSRPYTDAENAEVDAELAGLVPNQTEVDRQALRDLITAFQAEKDRAQTVLDNPAATAIEKDLARGVRRTADGAITLTRFIRRRL